MSFLENAALGKDGDRAANIRTLTAQALRQQDEYRRGDPVLPPFLVEMTIRYKRMNMMYEEPSIVLPLEALADVYALAESFLTYNTLHADVATGNPEYIKRVFLTPDRELLVIEVMHKEHKPEQNQDDIRRSKLRGKNSVAPGK